MKQAFPTLLDESRIILAHIERSDDLFSQRDYGAAIACFYDALQDIYRDDSYPRELVKRVKCFIGVALNEKGSYQKAIEIFHALYANYDRDRNNHEIDINILCGLGLAYYKLKDYQGALKYYKLAR